MWWWWEEEGGDHQADYNFTVFCCSADSENSDCGWLLHDRKNYIIEWRLLFKQHDFVWLHCKQLLFSYVSDN